MIRIIWLLVISVLLAGCVTYEFKQAQPPGKKGIVVARDAFLIPEFSESADKTFPDAERAHERFLRRRATVEAYYHKMGIIENRFRAFLIDRLVLIGKFATGVVRVPFLICDDYRVHHDPAYAQRKHARQDAEDAREESRLKQLHEQLDAYIAQDCAREGASIHP